MKSTGSASMDSAFDTLEHNINATLTMVEDLRTALRTVLDNVVDEGHRNDCPEDKTALGVCTCGLTKQREAVRDGYSALLKVYDFEKEIQK